MIDISIGKTSYHTGVEFITSPKNFNLEFWKNKLTPENQFHPSKTSIKLDWKNIIPYRGALKWKIFQKKIVASTILCFNHGDVWDLGLFPLTTLDLSRLGPKASSGYWPSDGIVRFPTEWQTSLSFWILWDRLRVFLYIASVQLHLWGLFYEGNPDMVVLGGVGKVPVVPYFLFFCKVIYQARARLQKKSFFALSSSHSLLDQIPFGFCFGGVVLLFTILVVRQSSKIRKSGKVRHFLMIVILLQNLTFNKQKSTKNYYPKVCFFRTSFKRWRRVGQRSKLSEKRMARENRVPNVLPQGIRPNGLHTLISLGDEK